MSLACQRHPELWASADDEDRLYAVLHCHACPLERSCRDRARDDLTGVRGGTTPEDRLLLEPVAAVVEHVASRAAYVGGCRCDGCREQNRLFIAAWRSRPTAPVTSAERLDVFEQLAMEVGS